jgi:lipoprotein-anchoring transpeptidase ErfK/SrfK
MTRSIFRLFAAAAAAALLSGCVTGTALIEAGLAQPPAPQVDDAAYVARQDGSFAIPAIPLEKLPTEYRRQTIYFPSEEAPGTVIVNPAARYLYLITGDNTAVRYGISVGKSGFEWSGVANVTSRKRWPIWTPPPEMIERKPELAKWEKGQPGGLTNPLGARALYLTTNGVDYGYRIHGTPEWQSIGSNASSGCIRMINQDIIDLYSRVPDGAKVVVLTRDGQMPTGLTLPPPPPKKVAKTAAPEPEIAPAAVPGRTIPDAGPV